MAKKDKKNTELDAESLLKKITDLREDIRKANFKMEGAKPKNVKEGRAIRKEIARALTELNKNIRNK